MRVPFPLLKARLLFQATVFSLSCHRMGYPANLFGLFTPPFQRQGGSQGEHRQEQHAAGGGPHRRTAKASPGTKEKALSPRQGALSRPSLGLGNGLLDNLPGELPDLFHLFPGLFGEGDFIQGRHLKQSLLKDRREEKVDSFPFHGQPSILIEGTLPADDETLLAHGIFLHLHRPFGFLAPIPPDDPAGKPVHLLIRFARDFVPRLLLLSGDSLLHADATNLLPADIHVGNPLVGIIEMSIRHPGRQFLPGFPFLVPRSLLPRSVRPSGFCFISLLSPFPMPTNLRYSMVRVAITSKAFSKWAR